MRQGNTSGYAWSAFVNNHHFISSCVDKGRLPAEAMEAAKWKRLARGDTTPVASAAPVQVPRTLEFADGLSVKWIIVDYKEIPDGSDGVYVSYTKKPAKPVDVPPPKV
jgi:hypothetical protein